METTPEHTMNIVRRKLSTAGDRKCVGWAVVVDLEESLCDGGGSGGDVARSIIGEGIEEGGIRRQLLIEDTVLSVGIASAEEEWEEGESEAEEQRIIDEGEQWTEEQYEGEEDGESWEDGGWDHDEEDNGSGDWNGEDSNEEDDEEGWEEYQNEEDGGEWDEEEEAEW